MEYYLVHFEPSTRSFYRGEEISKEVFDEYSDLHFSVNRYYRSFSLIKFPELAIEKFENGFNETIEIMEKHDFNREFFLNITFGIEFHLINYLANFRTYLDHTSTRLKKDYQELKLNEYFSDLTSEFYDNTFVYPFIYKLRNFVQHCSIPFTPEKIDRLKEGTSEFEKSEAKIYFDRDTLLSEYNSWSKLVSEKIEKQPKRIEVLSTIKESFNCLKEIEDQVKEKEKEILEPLAERIIEICKPVLEKNGNPGIAQFDSSKSKDDGHNHSMIQFPVGALISMGYEFPQFKEGKVKA